MVLSGEKVYSMGNTMTEITREEALQMKGPSVFLTTSKNARNILQDTEMNYEGDINLMDIAFCKVETQQECLSGTLYIPKMIDIMGSKYKVQFFINEKYVVIIDDEEFSGRIIYRIMQRRIHQADTKEKFLYHFLTELMSRDQMFLATYERNLIDLEKDIDRKRAQEIQNQIAPMRNELLSLQEYYDELRDLGKELEENENHLFDTTQLRYFGVVSDRADRLMNKTGLLIEYARQVKEDFETTITAKQNSTMQFLTIISTIFMPLTLITSWYGMNFENMPELHNGYPFVILLSLCVIIVTIIIFKKKKLF